MVNVSLETREDGSSASPSLAGVDLLVNMDAAAARPAPPRPAGEGMMRRVITGLSLDPARSGSPKGTSPRMH